MVVLLRSLLLVAVALAGCGRSGLIGRSPTDCPPGSVDPRCTSNFDLRPVDLGRDMRGDMRDGGVCPGEDFCAAEGCDIPGCCNCRQCFGALACRPNDMGDMRRNDLGDLAGDKCGDPDNCKLPECIGDPRCRVLGTEICNNGIDDDDDFDVDCDDADCTTFPGCLEKECDQNNPDCTSPLCVNHPKCQDLRCMPTLDFGTINPMGSSSTKMSNTTGTTDVTVTPCAPGGAGMVVGKFTLSASADVVLTIAQMMGDDHVFGLFRAGINQTCGANPVECYDPKGATAGSNTYQALPAGNYYVIAQPFSPQGQGPVTMTLSTATKAEICNNGIDDNSNNLIDCMDAECAMAPNCVNTQCKFDFNVGALVVNDPGKSVSFNTMSFDANNNLTCQGAMGGKDVVVRFTLQETAGILLQWSQSGDHVVGLMRTPDPGQKCDTNPISCYDPSGRNFDTVAWTEQPPGDYLFIFKGIRPGQEGQIDATISSYRNRRIELCHNGIDDDGNGLVDCADPGCIGVSGCSAPYCMPDRQLGEMSIGSSQTVNLNIQTDGTLGYNTQCARGGGKGMVVQLTVPEAGPTGGIGIGFDCTQTGDHVLDLFAAGGPRDACDVNELVCADPKTLPFGCGYEVPNLQPGTYTVIVQAFTPGSEGTMRLTLSVVDDRQLEICNDRVDNDRDGFTDCADRKCVTSQYCQSAQCRADTEIDPMPLDGRQVFRLVQTSGAGVHASLPPLPSPGCVTTPGGETAIIGFTLTAAADLTLNYQQIGNHDIGVFTNDGAALPCDAGTLLACEKGPGKNLSGMETFTNVPQGKYWIVVAADAPDAPGNQSSGSVNIAVSGMPH